MIEVRKLSFGYGREPVLRDVSAVFPDGAVTVILGPNGSGKSTLLETVAGLHEGFGGSVLLDGTPAETLSPVQRARRVAYMAQNRTVPHILARNMVLHGRFPHLGYPRSYRKEDYAAAEAALAAAGAADLANRPMHAMSGGQRQKVYIAMALAQSTRSILMDEPTNFLDVGSQLELMDLARGLARDGRAVVMVLHDLRLALEHADRICLLSGGCLLRAGTPEEVYASGLPDRVFGVKLRAFETPGGTKYYYE